MRHVLTGLVLALVVAVCGRGLFPDHVEFTGVEADLYRSPDQHCDWGGTWYLWIDGGDIRNYFTGDNDDLFNQALAVGSPWVVYVRDPDRITAFTYEAEPLLETTLPPGASLVSMSDGYELWADPADPHHLYVDDGTSVEGWVLATESFGCE